MKALFTLAVFLFSSVAIADQVWFEDGTTQTGAKVYEMKVLQSGKLIQIMCKVQLNDENIPSWRKDIHRIEIKDDSPTPTPFPTRKPLPQNYNDNSATKPSEITYSIICSEILPDNKKRALKIQLSRKVSEGTLRDISLRLKAQDPRSFDRTFIEYYLSGGPIDERTPAWASARFDPDLEIQIHGLTIKEEQDLISEHSSSNYKVVGHWIDIPIGSITIFYEDGKMFIEEKFKDGSKLKNEIKEKSIQGGRRFDQLKGSSYGDHWVLVPDGTLQIRDNSGLISIAKPVK